MARGIQPLMQVDTAENTGIYSNNPDAEKIYADSLTQDAAIATNFFGDNIAAYKNFINPRIAR
jgi:hypothetical protein